MAASQRSTRSKSVSSNPSKDKVSCIFCNQSIVNETPALNCDNCGNWVCQPCSRVPITLYNELTKCDSEFSPDWNCRSCKSIKADLKTIHSTLLDMKKDNDTRLASVEEGLANLTTTMKSTVKEEVDKVKDQITESVSNDLALKVKQIVNSQLKEMKERDTRSSNLIIFNLKTSSSKEPQERKKHDVDIISRLFKEVCPEQGEIELKTCFRLFIRKKQTMQEGSKPPPVKIVMKSKEQRRRLLLNSKNISSLNDDTLKNIIIVRDLTHEQRQDHSDLMKEKEDRESKGEKLEVRNGKLMPARPPRRSDPFR